MPVTACNEIIDNKWGPKVDRTGNFEFGRSFEVMTDVPMSGIDVALYQGLPQLYVPHPDAIAAYCVDIDPRQDQEDECYWVFNYTYSTKADALARVNWGQGGDTTNIGDPANQNPTLRTPTFEVSGRKYKEAMFKDWNGVLRKNAAGVMFAPYQREKTLLVLRVQKFVPIGLFNAQLIPLLSGAANSDLYLGWEPNTVLLDDLSAKLVFEHNVRCWDVNGVLVFKPYKRLTIAGITVIIDGGWETRVLEAGYEYWDYESDRLYPFLTAGGQRPSQPLLLYGENDPFPGTPLNDNGRYTGATGEDTPRHATFQDIPLQNLNQLPLFF